ncbi:MAG: SDR family oxidoreductase [Polyangiaceae bacterium]
MPNEVVLVTGFPGIESRMLVERILAEEPETKILLVVWHDLMDRAQLALESMDHRERIEVLAGDAAAIDFGLSGPEYRRVVRLVTRAHHLARSTYVGVSKATAHYTNVQGAIEMVELAAEASSLQCLVHHSSAFVSGDRSGTVYEDDLDEGQGYFSEVQRTQMQAERVMRRSMRELPITVLRPTMIVGDSVTGEVDRFGGPYLLVMLLLGVPGDLAVPMPIPPAVPVDFVPVDYVVKAAHHVGRHATALRRTLHLRSPERLTARDVFELIAQCSGRRVLQSYLPSHLANALVRTPGIKRVLQEPRAFLQQLSAGACYDDRTSRRILADTGIVCPALASYIDTWVSAVKAHVGTQRGVGSRVH